MITGDALDELAHLPDNSVHAVVTDPPYNLAFMGKGWDTVDAFAAWCEKWAAECLRVLRPGGHLLAFGGTRTWHHLATGVENAGFEIRDSIAWIYGSGFPKSANVSKAIDKAAGARREVIGTEHRSNEPSGIVNVGQGERTQLERHITAPATDAAREWDGWGTALKPAHEPIVVARKPLSDTVAATVQQWGTGGMNIDGCRVPADEGRPHITPNSEAKKQGACYNPRPGSSNLGTTTAGRWPTNVALDPDTAAALDEQSGTVGGNSVGGDPAKYLRGNEAYGEDLTARAPFNHPGGKGGASRFFPVFRYQAKAPRRERPEVDGIKHPTVKPLELMRWLCRLVTPPGGTVLDPFAGSGTTLQAAQDEGFAAIGIERDPAYVDLIHQRLHSTPPDEPATDKRTAPDPLRLFDVDTEDDGDCGVP